MSQQPVHSFTDKRDGNTYGIVQIGNLEWMTENLRYEGLGYKYPSDLNCYKELFGLLYTWENAQKACPDGWRLPTKDDLLMLVNYSTSKREKINPQLAGYFDCGCKIYEDCKPDFYDLNREMYLWSSTIAGIGAYCLKAGSGLFDVRIMHIPNALSVRCIRDIQSKKNSGKPGSQYRKKKKEAEEAAAVAIASLVAETTSLAKSEEPEVIIATENHKDEIMSEVVNNVICIKCGTEVPENENFCPQCGAALKCSCGRLIAKKDILDMPLKYCPSCGKKIVIDYSEKPAKNAKKYSVGELFIVAVFVATLISMAYVLA